MKIVHFLFVISCSVLLVFSSCSCSFDWLEKTKQEITLERGIKITTWNTQTFFDAVKEGTEFFEFIGENSLWSEEKYLERVKRLCEVTERINADVLVLQEVENEAVVQDIMNSLHYTTAYEFASFAKEEGDAFGCAVLSRLPITSIKTHQLNSLLAITPNQPRLRPLFEVTLRTENNTNLTVFVCHWKSKVGGEDKTDMWRQAQEDLLRLHAKKALANSVVVAAGDFNRTEDEFSNDFNSLFYNGWSAVLDEKGSYVYEDSWERIDAIFLAKDNLSRLVQFTSEASGDHASSTGKPKKYEIYTGEGYSDHLPVSATVTLIQ